MKSTITIGKTTYKVKATPTEKWTAYELRGPRDAFYRLVRNSHRQHMLFAVNARKGCHSMPFKGDWFSDKDGELRLL